MRWGLLRILFLRTMKPEKLNFTWKLSGMEQRQVDYITGPEGQVRQMEMKCILYLYMTKVTQVSNVAHGPLVSSPELKAQVNFSDRQFSVVCPSVHLPLSVRLLHFQLLQNRLVNFNQSWHISSSDKGDSELYKWRTPPSPRGDNSNRVKIHYNFF
jgi:hypothetical protein